MRERKRFDFDAVPTGVRRLLRDDSSKAKAPIYGAPKITVTLNVADNLYLDSLAALRPISSIPSISELNVIIEPVLAKLGFRAFAGVLVPDRNRELGLRVLFGKGLESWMRWYSDMAYEICDAMIDECRRSINPFYWSDLVARRAMSESNRRVFEDARDFGFEDGFVAPIQKADGLIFFVVTAGQPSQGSKNENRVLAQMLATYYGLSGLKLHNATLSNPSFNCLTVRQSECLRWVRAGKSSTDIGTILGISGGVVDEHIEKACRRLRVFTRMQAVITADSLGYLDR